MATKSTATKPRPQPCKRPSNRAAASKPVPTAFDSALSRWAAEKRLWTTCLAGGVREGTHVAAGSRQDRQEW